MQLPWGELYLVSDGEVLQAAWKDQNVVLFMTTVSNGVEKILRLRRRPPKTATNAKTSRIIFGDLPVLALLIPRFIDDYNHFMGGVDQADQLRSYYGTQRTHRKTWKPLWHFLLDTTITNCFKIHTKPPPGATSSTYKRYTQKSFRTELAIALFDHSERLTKSTQAPQQPLTYHVTSDVPSEHRHIVLSQKASACKPCLTTGRRPTAAKKRKPLGELHHNVGRSDQGVKKRKLERTKTRYGCELCQLYVCQGGSCWKEHLEAIQ